MEMSQFPQKHPRKGRTGVFIPYDSKNSSEATLSLFRGVSSSENVPSLLATVSVAAMILSFLRRTRVKTTALMKVTLNCLLGDTGRALREVIDYLVAEVRVLHRRYEQDCGRRLLLTEEQRRAVIEHGHRHVIQIGKPDTLHALVPTARQWFRVAAVCPGAPSVIPV